MVNGEDYYTRKGDYAIKGLVICDDAVRITWVEMGWPGSVHYNCVWANSEIYLSKDKYFEKNLSEEQRYFNNKLAKIWIKSEHCIGLLKAGFQCLEGFWRVIQDKQDLDAILRQAMCACIIHNLLINHPVLLDWFDETIEELDQDDELHQSVEQSGGDTRRNQVFAYMLEEC